MKKTEFICAISFGIVLGTYCALILWSPVGKRFAKHELPGHLRPVLAFWGLTPDATGYERMNRNAACILLFAAAASIGLALWQFIR